MGTFKELAIDRSVPLNAICPYFTMFPLSFPHRVLGRAATSDSVLDPFCGRGTTSLAARIRGIPSAGIDTHPVATAVTQAKLTTATPGAITDCLAEILDSEPPRPNPQGPFWSLAFHPTTLADLTRIRAALLRDSSTPARIALRAILLGALHGPLTKSTPSYLSNQSPRTYAPKPRYAVRYWTRHNMRPPRADIRKIVAVRAARQFDPPLDSVAGSRVVLGDSTDPDVFAALAADGYSWIITSPPYYGMNTYGPDQWLRLWLLGGPENVDYTPCPQISHNSPQRFAQQLRRVWTNCAAVARPGARLVIRFGSLPKSKHDPIQLLRTSLTDTPWRIQTRQDAGAATPASRQANHFGTTSAQRSEFDCWAVLAG